jgi:hypothetical protein
MDWIALAVFGTLGVVVVVGPVAGLLLCVLRRRHRFSARCPMGFDEWYRAYAGETECNPEVVREVVTELAEALLIDPTQLRLEDSFGEHFAFLPRWVGVGDEFDDAVRAIARYYGIEGWRAPPSDATLGQFLDQVGAAARRRGR